MTPADKAAELLKFYVERKMIAGFHDKTESVEYLEKLSAVFAKYEGTS